MKTGFSQHNMDFTKRAHAAAQTQFYAEMFPGLTVEFVDTVGTVRDLEYAIDCELAVTVPDLRAPLLFKVQERWRRPEEMHWGDVTITEWNLASGQPSELYKLGAQLCVGSPFGSSSGRERSGRTRTSSAFRSVTSTPSTRSYTGSTTGRRHVPPP